jgi:hypothetical protein
LLKLLLLLLSSAAGVFCRVAVVEDVLPPSLIITTAADNDDVSTQQQHQQQQQQPPAARYLVTSVSNLTNNSSRLSVSSGPGFGRASQDQADVHLSGQQHDLTGQQQMLLQYQDGPSTHSSAAAAAAAQQGAGVSDNPLDVMLTIRAGRIGDSAETMRQQLLLMKLASGRNNFDTQVSAFNASMQLPDSLGLDTSSSGAVAGMRVASVTLASPARRGSVANQGRAAKLAASQRAASVPLDMQLDAAANAATAAVGVVSAPGGGVAPGAAAPAGAAANAGLGSSGFEPAGSIHSQTGGTDAAAAAAAAGCGQPQHLKQSSSLASMRNSSMHRSLIMRQPSLQRLLSGSSRSHLPSRTSDDQSMASDMRSLPGSAAAAGPDSTAGNGSVSTAADRSSSGQLNLLQQPQGGVLPNGDLPIIQQQLGSQQQQQQLVGAACYASGLLGSTHGAGASGMITEEGEEDSDDDGLTCEICFDAAAVVSLQACGHALCVGCCREMCKLHHFKPALCPYCRQIICGFGARMD